MTQPYDPRRAVPDFLAIHRAVSSTLVFGERPIVAPRVSIVIPTFRRAAMLEQALISALAQRDFDDYEIVVVDNDAEQVSAETQEVVERHLVRRLRYYRNASNLGMTGNWNRGIELACGQWITLLHDDDWLAPNFLVRMFGLMPMDARFMTCKVQLGPHGYDPILLRPSKPRHARAQKLNPRQFVRGNVSPAPGVLLQRSLALQLRGYDDTLYPCADYDFNIRATINGGAYAMFERLAFYRTSDGETFNGNTLERIISTSAWIKRGLMLQAPSIGSSIYYIDSMRNWYRMASRLRRSLTITSRLDRFAMWVSRSRWATKVAKRLAGVIEWRDRSYSE